MFKNLIIAGVLIACLAIPGVADAKVFYLSLTTSITTGTSGTTTVASGTSEVVINSGVTVIPRLYNFDQFQTAVQIRTVNGLTIAAGESSKGGDHSGVTFTLRYKESLVDDQAYWDAATAVNVFNGVLFSSGTSLQQQEIFPVGLGFMKWEFISGITPMGNANFIFTVLD